MTRSFIYAFLIGVALGCLGGIAWDWSPNEPLIFDGMQAYCTAPEVPFIDDQKHSAGCVKP